MRQALACFFPPEDEAPELSPYEKLRERLEDHASAAGLKKKAGMVYSPIPGCPCAYEPLMSYEDHINHVLKGDSDYVSRVKHHLDLVTYMNVYNEDAFPRLETDVDLLSFANGVLILSTYAFIPYSDYADSELAGRVARHHIPSDWTDDTTTPLFDKILAHQFGETDCRLEVLYALIGRLFFQVRQLDHWEVMPFFLGEAGTGKSTVLSVISAMFAKSATADIDCNTQKTFGLQEMYDKEVVMIKDAPEKMSEVLSQEILQKMVTGETIHISVKHRPAFDVTWKAPILAASNHPFDYKDNQGQMSRRVVIFRFDSPLASSMADTTLESRILSTELPNLVARSLSAYFGLVRSLGSASFWSACPDVLKESREDAMIQGNLVYRFLRAGINGSRSKTSRYYVRRIEGQVTSWEDFKKAFEAFKQYNHRSDPFKVTTNEKAPFMRLGYELSHDHICSACHEQARVGCCVNYSNANRSKRWRIWNMELVRESLEGDGGYTTTGYIGT